jgi:hypothetical protein
LRGEQPYLPAARILPASLQEDIMSAALIIYQRGTQYVGHPHGDLEHSNGTKEKAGTAYGLVGKLSVGGHSFDTLERMEDYINLPEDIYPMSSMYSVKGLGTVVNPWMGDLDGVKGFKNLLIHSAPYVYNLQGCIAPGKLVAPGASLTESSQAITKIWELCGGGQDRSKKIVVTLRVIGKMRPRSKYTKFSG